MTCKHASHPSVLQSYRAEKRLRGRGASTYLRVSATGGAALDTEGRPLARLSEGDERVGAPVGGEGLHEPEGGGGLALAEWRRRDARDDDVLTVLLVLQTLQDAQADLGLLAAVGAELAGQDADLLGEDADVLGLVGPRDRDVARHRPLELQVQHAQLPLAAQDTLGGALRRQHRVLHEHGYGHGPDTAGHRGYVGGDLRCLGVGYVAHQPLAGFLRRVCRSKQLRFLVICFFFTDKASLTNCTL